MKPIKIIPFILLIITLLGCKKNTEFFIEQKNKNLTLFQLEEIVINACNNHNLNLINQNQDNNISSLSFTKGGELMSAILILISKENQSNYKISIEYNSKNIIEFSGSESISFKMTEIINEIKVNAQLFLERNQ